MLVKNIGYSVLYRVLSLAISFAMVPLLINILGVSEYGLWVTLTSLITWVSIFDFGLGYALKNTVTKSLANGDLESAQNETWQILKVTLPISLLLMLALLLSPLFFNLISENFLVSIILFIPVVASFPFKIGSPILQGARMISLESGILFMSPFLFFLLVVFFHLLEINIALYQLASGYALFYSFSVLWVWVKALNTLSMKVEHFNKIISVKIDVARVKIGLKFFGLQLSSLILYSIGTILVYSYLGSVAAARFDTLNKIFLAGMGVFNIGIASFWPEISNSLENKDFIKVKKYYLIMMLLSFVFCLGSLLVAMFSPELIYYWVGGEIVIYRNEAIWFAILVSIQAMAYCGAVVLNAFEKINYQLVLSIISSIALFPLAIFVISKGFGISSVPIASALLTIPALIYCNIHAYKLIREN